MLQGDIKWQVSLYDDDGNYIATVEGFDPDKVQRLCDEIMGKPVNINLPLDRSSLKWLKETDQLRLSPDAYPARVTERRPSHTRFDRRKLWGPAAAFSLAVMFGVFAATADNAPLYWWALGLCLLYTAISVHRLRGL